MNLRKIGLFAILCLSACNDSSPPTSDASSTFVGLASARTQLAGVNAEIAAGKLALADATTREGQLAGEIAAKETRLKELKTESEAVDSALTEAKANLDQLTKEAAGIADKRDEAKEALATLGAGADQPGSIAAAQKKLNDLLDQFEKKNDELSKAKKALDILNAGVDQPGSIAAAQKKLDDLVRVNPKNPGAIAAAQRKLDNLTAKLAALIGDGADNKGAIKEAQEELALLVGDGAGKKGAIKEAQEELEHLQEQVKSTKTALDLAQETLDELIREDADNPGEIAKAQKALSDLVLDATAKKDELKLAQQELERLNSEAKGIIDAAKREALLIKADAFKDAGKFLDAAQLLQGAGLFKEAADMFEKAGKPLEAADMFEKAGMKREAGQIFMAEGMEDRAFDLVAPENNVVKDTKTYIGGGDGAISLSAISETPSAKRQKMDITIDGVKKTVKFTASAGHLIVYAPKDPANPATKDAQAAIYYMAYTRDGVAREKRPVTFFFNGGPGQPSYWLHLGSWAPKRLKTNEPTIPPSAMTKAPASFDLIQSQETLLDKSDLVFVDPVGAGYSQAIAPHKNRDFWNTEVDAKLMKDFIVRYVNVNKRQLSPKYIYGESYSGIRVPLMSRLIEAAGKSQFDADESGKDPIVLSGLILNAPILSYHTNCANDGPSCAGYIPAYAMLADYYKLSKVNGLATIPASVDPLRQFVKDSYMPALAKFLPDGSRKEWTDYVSTIAGMQFLQDMKDKTGVSSWNTKLNMGRNTFLSALRPSYAFNLYDARMSVPYVNRKQPYDPTYYEDVAFDKGIKDILPDYLNYNATATYRTSNNPGLSTSREWNWDRPGSTTPKSSLPDLQATLEYDPSLKVVILHGYYDLVTPFYQTELDIEGAKLSARIPVRNFKGGHMTYTSEEARIPLKQALDEFYDAPPFSQPPNLALN